MIADVLALPLNFANNGFSPIYHWSINVASVFYLVIGLVFLMSFLKIRFGHNIALITIASLFLATNLFYYAIDETGMSHVYSFSLFCIFLYIVQQTSFLKNCSIWTCFTSGLIIGLIFLIRPTNILFLSAFFFLDITNKGSISSRFKIVLKGKKLMPIAAGVFIIILPQLLYWNYLTGSFFNDMYVNEGFNWLHPEIIKNWFSPNNGLFIYTPFYLIIIAFLITMIKNKEWNGIYIGSLFLIISYTFSSWWAWNFGCSFGARSYVEYLSIFSIPIAAGLGKISKLNNIKMVIFILLICITYNLKLTYTYDRCFFGKNDWDWNAYAALLLSPTK